MLPEIRTFSGVNLIGMSQTMTFADDSTFLLWSTFMPRRNEIQNKIDAKLYNVVFYPEGFNFSPDIPFVKWATVAVNPVPEIASGMQSLFIPEGLYAVFVYKGKNTEANSFFKYIFADWLPSSDYTLDNRPHFEILGEKFKHGNADSEEEVWIPIRLK